MNRRQAKAIRHGLILARRHAVILERVPYNLARPEVERKVALLYGLALDAYRHHYPQRIAHYRREVRP